MVIMILGWIGKLREGLFEFVYDINLMVPLFLMIIGLFFMIQSEALLVAKNFKEENELTNLNGFKADNFQKVLDYMNEVKPFSAKVREYKDGKKAPVDVIGQNNISDYDKPPFVDLVSGTVRILDENVELDT